MLNCCSLYSGSTGNSFFVQTENTKLLIDAGVSCKKIEDALASINVSPKDIDAIFITHEHIDHTKSIGMLSKKYGLPIYTNTETWQAILNSNNKLPNVDIHFFENDKTFEFKDLKIHPFSTPHDAANPCGFNIFKDKKKLSIATDLGHMSADIIKNLENSSFLMLEANYDSNVLKYSTYPYMLKKRIAGPNGHLENNFPELAYKTVVEELQKQNLSENCISLNVAPRDLPSNLFQVV